MKFVVCKIEQKKGVIKENNQPYDNMILGVLLSEENPIYYRNLVGGRPYDEIKIKTEQFNEIVYDKEKLVRYWNDLLWCEVDVYKDTNDKILCVEVVSVDGKAKL